MAGFFVMRKKEFGNSMAKYRMLKHRGDIR